MVESGGGKTAKGNNLFGWANGKLTFSTIGEAIHTVASSLAHGRAYRGKDTGGKLAAYNQGTDYPAMVLEIMRQISPRPTDPVRRLMARNPACRAFDKPAAASL